MRVWLLGCACALAVGACLLPKYSVVEDGGAGAAGTSGTPGAAGTSAGGRGGTAGGATGVAGGSAGSGGRGGAAGSVGATGGTGGAISIAGTGGLGGGTAGTGGSSAGRGGTTGTAGTGGGAAGRGGTTGTAGGGAGRGGTTGTAGTGGGAAGRGGTTGTAGSSAGRGGSSAGTGGSSVGGSTAAPSWLNDISAVWQFDTNTPLGELGVEAHGLGPLHLESQGTNIPQLSATAIEGGSVSLIGTLQYPSYMQSPGATLPGVFQTGSTNSWTTGGWFHITATSNQQWLIHDEGPTNFQDGGFFFYVDQQMGRLSSGTAFAYCRAGVSYNEVTPENSNMKEVETPQNNLIGNLGFDQNVSGNWVHLVCRYNANTNELSILVGGLKRAGVVDTLHQVASGPGPFMIGCNEAGYCALQGNADEVFWATSALPDYDVLRIYACGIDGSRCRCDGSGSGYANCGFLQGGCGLLPACNAATP